MSTVTADFAAQFAARRMASHALSLAFDPGLARMVLSRFIFLLTADDEFDVKRLELLLYQHSSQEVDVALLRAVADVMEALEDERCHGLEIDGAD
jgi:hypothetical protein